MTAPGFMGKTQFDMGRVINRTFGTVGGNIRIFAPAALLFIALPQAIVGWVQLEAVQSAAGVNIAWIFSVLGFIVSLAASVMLQGVLTHTAIADLDHREPNARDSYAAAFQVFWILLAVGFLTSLGGVLGLILLVVPGVILMLMWAVVGPVVVIERLGVTASFDRSRWLTRDHRLKILGLAVLYLIVTLVLSGFISLMFRGVTNTAGTNPEFLVALVFSPLVSAATSMIGAAGVAAIYVELRTVKEGGLGGRERIGDVFD